MGKNAENISNTRFLQLILRGLGCIVVACKLAKHNFNSPEQARQN